MAYLHPEVGDVWKYKESSGRCTSWNVREVDQKFGEISLFPQSKTSIQICRQYSLFMFITGVKNGSWKLVRNVNRKRRG